MSQAASRAISANKCFREVQVIAADTSEMKLAQGLRALAEAIEILAREQNQIQDEIQAMRSGVGGNANWPDEYPADADGATEGPPTEPR